MAGTEQGERAAGTGFRSPEDGGVRIPDTRGGPLTGGRPHSPLQPPPGRLGGHVHLKAVLTGAASLPHWEREATGSGRDREVPRTRDGDL